MPDRIQFEKQLRHYSQSEKLDMGIVDYLGRNVHLLTKQDTETLSHLVERIEKNREHITPSTTQDVKAISKNLRKMQSVLENFEDLAYRHKAALEEPPKWINVLTSQLLATNRRKRPKIISTFFEKEIEEDKKLTSEFIPHIQDLIKLLNKNKKGYGKLLTHILSMADPQMKLQLVKHCIASNLDSDDPHISRLRDILPYMKNQEHRFELALSCAQVLPKSIVHYVEELNLTEEQRIKLAKKLAQIDGFQVALYIDHFNISDKNMVRKIGAMALAQSKEALDYMKRLGFDRKHPTVEIFFAEGRWGLPTTGDPSEMLEALSKSHCDSMSFETTLKRLPAKPEERNQHLIKIGAALLFLSNRLTDEQLSWVEEQGLLAALANLPDNHLQDQLIEDLVRVATASHRKDFSSKEPNRLLTEMLCNDLETLGIESKIIDVLRKCAGDHEDSALGPLVELLIGLSADPIFSADQKKIAIEWVSKEGEELLRRSELLSALILLGQTQHLTSDDPILQAMENKGGVQELIIRLVTKNKASSGPLSKEGVLYLLQIERMLRQRPPKARSFLLSHGLALSDDRLHQQFFSSFLLRKDRDLKSRGELLSEIVKLTTNPAERNRLINMMVQQIATSSSYLVPIVQDESFRIQFAKQLAIFEPYLLEEHIKKLKISDKEALTQMAATALRKRKTCRVKSFGVEVNSNTPELYFAQAHWKNPHKGNPKKLLESLSKKYCDGADLVSVIDQSKRKEKDKRQLYLRVGALFPLLINRLSEKQLRWLADQGLLDAFAEFKNRELAETLIESLIRVASSQEGRQAYEAAEKDAPGHQLLHLLISDFAERGAARKELEAIRKTVLNIDDPKDFDTLLETLIQLSATDDLNRFGQMINMAKRGRAQLLSWAKAVNNLLSNGIAIEKVEKLKNLPGLRDVPDLFLKFAESFGQTRNPRAILDYLYDVSSYGDSDAIQALTEIIKDELNGEFTTKRYDQEFVEILFKDLPGKLELWKKGLSASVADLVGEAPVKETQISTLEWLKLKLEDDRHLDNYQKLEELTWLKGYLDADSKNERDEIAKGLRAELQKVGKEIAQKKGKPNEEELARINQLSIQNLFIQLAEAEGDKKKQLTLLNNIKNKKALVKTIFLAVDYKEKHEQLKSASKPSERLNVYETDRLIDILLCGTELSGSCQDIYTHDRLNLGLLGYMLHGWVRVLKVAEGPDEPFKGRCLIRLLTDGEKTVMLLERFYPSTITSENMCALEEMAKRKAKLLGVPLVSMLGSGKQYGKDLLALGGPSPYEYVDSAFGMKLNGQYTVKGARHC